MNTLIDFLKRNFHYILFAFLQILCIVMIYNSMTYSHFVIATASQKITSPVNKFWYGFVRHFSLETENEALIKQNIKLLNQKENIYFLKEDSVYTAFVIDTLVSKTNKIKMYDYTYANVVYKTTHKIHNYIIIDKGSDDGITVDMAVLSSQGVVGVVSDVSPHFASVISLLHPDSRISAKVMPINQIGTIMWEDNDPEMAVLHDIPQHLNVEIGDSIVTSGYSNVFPKDILIGVVNSKVNNTKNSFYTIQVKLATNFNNLNKVYVISNLYKPEIDSLKLKFKNE
ncbi:MAG: rod shape-determining protein MreC [Bacteroidales bacterium]